MSNDRRGFSLLEVMLAVLVLGLALTAFFSAASQGVGAVARARGYRDARELMDWVALKEPLDLEELEEGSESGRLEHPQLGSFRWEREIAIEGREEDRLFRIRTVVEGGDEDRPVRESMERFLYEPDATRGDWVREPFDE